MSIFKRGNPFGKEDGRWCNDILVQEEGKCAVTAVAQCLLEMGIRAAPWWIELKMREFGYTKDDQASSIHYALVALERFGTISSLSQVSSLDEMVTDLAYGPCVLGLHIYEGMERKDFAGYLSLIGSKPLGKHAVTATKHHPKRFFGLAGGYTTLIDPRESIGRCKISDEDLRTLFERGEAACYVPVR
jgi:hypothetical protein